MKRKITLIAALLILVSFAFAAEIEACSCVPRSGCQYASSSDAVFVGKVVDSSEIVRKVTSRIRPIGGEWETEVREEGRQLSKLWVEESFLGVGDAQEIFIETDISSSCAFPLIPGETYIIYAQRSDSTENLMTGFCSGSKPLSSAQKEVEGLRAERGKLSTVAGRIGFGRFGKLEPKRLKEFGISKINLIGNGSSEETKVLPDGTFRFLNVPAGKYRLEPIIPDTLVVDGEYNDEIAEELEIEDQRKFTVSGIGCIEKELPIRENGRIGGRLTDETGGPVGNVKVYAVPIDRMRRPIKQEESCYDTDLCVSSNEDGTYLLNGLKPGRYLIGVRLDDYVCNDCANSAFKKAYYPGVPSVAKARSVTVGFGKKVENVDLKLVEKYREREITGIVVFKDGKPAANVSVRYVARTPDTKRNGITFIKTDADGNFRIVGYEEHSYLIGAFTDQRDGDEMAEAKAVTVIVRPGRSLDPIRLVLDQPDTDDDYFDFDIGGRQKPKN